MSSDASQEGAAEALDTLAWLDEDEADALAQLFDGAARSASAAGSDGGSVCVAGAEQEEAEFAGLRAAAAPLAPLSARRDGLRWLDADCARGCDKCAAPARVAGTPRGRQRTPRPQ